MSAPIPQAILDRLTDIAMPRLANERPPQEFVSALGFRLPVRRCDALVLGSGAAGLRAAVELKRRDVDVAIATQSAFGGTSACSGSDKQTLHTANGADRGDDFRAMADALGAGGAMDEDTAYVEAVGSPRALASLQFMGLPIPQDRLGGVLRYQTDHDEVGRATSCGPRTSRLMVQALAREAMRLEVPIFNNTTGVRILVSPRPSPSRQPASWPCARSTGPRTIRWASSSFSATRSSSPPAAPANSIATASIPGTASARSASRSRPGSRPST